MVVVLAVGGGLWWQGGGFGGPVGDDAARTYFDRIVTAALTHDFDGLCRLNGREQLPGRAARLLPRSLRLRPRSVVPRGR